MSLNAILGNGVSAVQTNSAALRVTSDNIANVNTPGYAQRVVNLASQLPGGQLGGVEIANVQRVVSDYLDAEVLNAGAASARYDVQSSLMTQLNAALGQPGDGNSIGSQLTAVYAALGQASLTPGSQATQLSALTQFQTFAQSISSLASSVASLRSTTDQQVSSVVSQANTLIQQIYALNPQIQHAIAGGDTASGLLDQRDQLVSQLSNLVGVRTIPQTDGRLFVTTSDGVQLVGDAYAQLTYTLSGGPSFSPVTMQMVSGQTGQPVGTAQPFDPHATSGQLRGLLDLRDNTLVDIGSELGSLAQSVSLAFNAVHNANSTVPPPSTLDGRDTGLLATDGLNFTGKTTIGIANANGTLVHNIAIDFGAGTITVDGGAPSAIGNTIGSFVTALNGALGANGSANFTDGKLTLSANGGNGLVISDDPATPSQRGGLGFSNFFGLNDLFQASGNAIQTTGLTAADTHGFSNGQSITLLLKGPQGQRVGEATVAVTGSTIGDMITALNNAFTGKATFALDANGQLQVSPAAAYAGYNLEVTADSTARGTTGQSLSQLFGLGTGQAMAQAQGFDITSDIAASPSRLSFAQPTLDAATAIGAAIVTPGDNRGLLALQDLGNSSQAFAKAGALSSQSMTFSAYAAAFYQDVGSRGKMIDNTKSAQDARLQVAQQSQSQVEGVNLDQELEKMMMYQQAYNAGARIIQVTQQLYDQLLSVVGTTAG